jgi:hypothetical protein
MERSKIEQEKSSTFDHDNKNITLKTDSRIEKDTINFERSSSKSDRESGLEINQKNELVIEMKDQSAERLPAPSASMEMEI